MPGKSRYDGNPKNHRHQIIRDTDPNFAKMKAPCCSCHPLVHDEEGCLLCGCTVPESRLVSVVRAYKPTPKPAKRAYHKKQTPHVMTESEEAAVRTLEEQSMPTAEELEQQAFARF